MWAPVPGNRLYQAKSDFWDFVLRFAAVKRRQADYSGRPRLEQSEGERPWATGSPSTTHWPKSMRALRGDIVPLGEVDRLVDTHLRAPFAYPSLKENLQEAARR